MREDTLQIFRDLANSKSAGTCDVLLVRDVSDVDALITSVIPHPVKEDGVVAMPAPAVRQRYVYSKGGVLAK